MLLRRRLVVWGGSSALAFTAIVGFAHTGPGRSLLRLLPGVGCPLDRGPVSPEQLDQARQTVLEPYRGEASASQHTVLAFELGQSRRAQIQQWATATAARCEDRSPTRMRCVDGTEDATVRTFSFDRDNRLVALDTSVRNSDVADAVAQLQDRATELAMRHGTPSSSHGSLDAAHLDRGPLTQTSVEYRFSDLRATLSATNLGHGGYVVRETWQSIDSAG